MCINIPKQYTKNSHRRKSGIWAIWQVEVEYHVGSSGNPYKSLTVDSFMVVLSFAKNSIQIFLQTAFETFSHGQATKNCESEV